MAITSANFQGYRRVGPNSYEVRINIVTNDSRGTFERWLTVTGDTLAQLRDAASAQIAAMTAADSRQDILAGIANGTNIPITYTPPAPAAPTAEQAWLGKLELYKRLTVTGITYTGAALAAYNALRDDIIATAAAAYFVVD